MILAKRILGLSIVLLSFNCNNQSDFSYKKLSFNTDISKLDFSNNDMRYGLVNNCELDFTLKNEILYTSLYVNLIPKPDIKGTYLIKNDTLMIGVDLINDESLGVHNELVSLYKFTYRFSEFNSNKKFKVCFMYDSLAIKYPNDKIKYFNR